MNQLKSGWLWVPSLYIFQGLPCCFVMTTSSLLYKDMGVSIESFAFWTSLVCLPWSFKPLWAPFVERIWTKRAWVFFTQIVVTLAFVLLGASFLTDSFYVLSLIIMCVVAFLSASHDIACDGYYMLALNEKAQSFFVGIRSTFYRVAMILATGGIPFFTGWLQNYYSVAVSWCISVCSAAVFLMLLCGINRFGMPCVSERTGRQDNGLLIFVRAFRSFFSHEGVVPAILFFLLYRLGESLITKVVGPFLIDDRAVGGLGLELSYSGVVYGTFGVISLVVGGVVGGWLASRYGLKRALWPMVLCMNLPNIVYVALAHSQPDAGSAFVVAAVMIEQFGYGIGFAAYSLCMLRYVGEAEYKAAEYSICTAFMSLSLLLPGMVAGSLQQMFGYEMFFLIACLATIPGMLSVFFLKIK